MKRRFCAVPMSLSLLLSMGCIVDATSVQDTEFGQGRPPQQPESLVSISPAVRAQFNHSGSTIEVSRQIRDGGGRSNDCLYCPTEAPKAVQLGDPQCNLSPRWSQDGGELYNGIRSAKLSNNGRLVYGATFDSDLIRTHPLDGAFATAYRTADGEPLFQIETDALPRMLNPKNDLNVTLEHRCQGECRGNEPMVLVARPNVGGEGWRMPLGDNLYRPQLMVSPNGETAVLSDCLRTSPRTRDTRIRTIDVATGVVDAEMTVPGECLYNPVFGFESRLLSKAGRYLVLTQRYRHDMRLFDLVAGMELELPTGPMSKVVNVAFNHDDTRLLAVTMEADDHGQAVAKLRQWRFPDLADMPTRSDISILGLNRLSYMPIDVSPLTFSRDGRLFAHLDSRGQVVIERTDSGERLHTLNPLNFDARGAEHWGNTGSEPVGIQLGPSGDGVLVSYTGGLAYFSCQESASQPRQRPRTITLSGPLQTAVGVPVTYTASAEHSRDLQGFGFSIDGDSLGFPTTTPTLTWTFREPGLHRVDLDFLDGSSAGHASLMVTVSP
ncbi:MAG: hypothetical protein VYA30_05200 [Myxococcota bacterium]|nr:hypothetical protein [Myxococcota bacterium]